MSNLKQPLSSLSLESPDVSPCNVKSDKSMWTGGSGGSGFLFYLIWFIIIAIVVWVILVATHPTWVQYYNELGQPTGIVDQAKAITWSVVIALIIVIIIWIIRAAAGNHKKEAYVC